MIIWNQNIKPEKNFLSDLESFIVANHKSKDHYFTTYYNNDGLDEKPKTTVGIFLQRSN